MENSVPVPARPPKASGPMLEDLRAALGGQEALQQAISERVLSSPPGRLRMDVVAELWRERCAA